MQSYKHPAPREQRASYVQEFDRDFAQAYRLTPVDDIEGKLDRNALLQGVMSN
jgi:hypothetical protein